MGYFIQIIRVTVRVYGGVGQRVGMCVMRSKMRAYGRGTRKKKKRKYSTSFRQKRYKDNEHRHTGNARRRTPVARV